MSHTIRTFSQITLLLLALAVFFSVNIQSVFALGESVANEYGKNTNATNNGSDNKNQADSINAPPTSGFDLLWTIVRLVLALGLIIVLIYLLVRFLSRRSGNYYSQRKLRIVAGIGLSPQKTLQVVDVGGKIYILGVGQDVRVLDKIEDPVEVAMLLESLDNTLLESELITSWKDRLKTMFKKKQITSEDIDVDDFESMFSTQVSTKLTEEATEEESMEENKERSNE